MAFVPKYAAEWRLKWKPKKASTALSNGAVVVQDSSSSGQLILGTTTTKVPFGIIQKAVASTDSDYTSTTLVPVLVQVIPQATLIAGTASTAASAIGTAIDIASGGLTVDPGATTTKVFVVTAVRSASICEGYFEFPATTN